MVKNKIKKKVLVLFLFLCSCICTVGNWIEKKKLKALEQKGANYGKKNRFHKFDCFCFRSTKMLVEPFSSIFPRFVPRMEGEGKKRSFVNERPWQTTVQFSRSLKTGMEKRARVLCRLRSPQQTKKKENKQTKKKPFAAAGVVCGLIFGLPD